MNELPSANNSSYLLVGGYLDNSKAYAFDAIDNLSCDSIVSALEIATGHLQIAEGLDRGEDVARRDEHHLVGEAVED